MYIADTSNNRVRKVTVSTGIITTFAGTGTGSYSGDNGPATSAELNGPVGVRTDSAGSSDFLTYSFTFYLITFLFPNKVMYTLLIAITIVSAR